MTSSKWSATREADFIRIRNLLKIHIPLIHVLGPHGSGKTSLVQDVLRDSRYVFVDANTCGSVAGVMSCILRRLSSMKSRSTGVSSPDSDLETKEEKAGHVKQELTTPDEVRTAENLPSPRKNAVRKCAVVTNERIAAIGTGRGRSGAASKRRLLDDLIDDDESDSDASENDSSSEVDEEDDLRPSRSHRVKNSKVPIEVLRVLYRAQSMAVKSQSAFVQKLERVLSKVREEVESTTIVIDKVDSILCADDFDLDPAGGKTTGSDFLRLLSRLNEYLAMRTKLNIVLISARHLPDDVSGRCVTVHLREYSADDCKDIIAEQAPDLETWFISNSIAVLYPVFTGNVGLLRDALVRIRRDPQLIRANQPALVSVAKSLCGLEMRRLFGGVDDDHNPEQQVRDLEAAKRGTRWLSTTEKHVLIAGYLAAHNPPNCDKIIFRTIGGHAGPVGRKKTASSNAFRKGKLNADSINVRAPVPFNLHRLLTIYRYISGLWENDQDCDSGVLFNRTVRSLIQHGLFKSPASEDWLRGGTKLNCHAPHDLIEVIASSLNVKLDEVLYG